MWNVDVVLDWELRDSSEKWYLKLNTRVQIFIFIFTTVKYSTRNSLKKFEEILNK
jgi:hypothetical protein